jgi:hypothetical protein
LRSCCYRSPAAGLRLNHRQITCRHQGVVTVKSSSNPSSSSPASETGAQGAPPRPHLPEAARRGGQAVVEKYGREYMATLGKRGAQSLTEKYGPEVFARMGARNRGVRKRRRRAE